MSKLTDQEYWENHYRDDHTSKKKRYASTGLKSMLKALVGVRFMDLISPYDDYLLWKVVFPRYLPGDCSGLRAVEIGSAPGTFLVRFAKTFGATVHGVEYTHFGAELNRFNFESNGFDPKNVIEADFFSPEFLEQNAGTFDIVISRGFIEHFDNPADVISRHVALLRKGGFLIVLIPNLLGIYNGWTTLFNPVQLPLHNLQIMRLARFSGLFDASMVDTLQCGYFGTFSFWLFTAADEARWIIPIVKILTIIQRPLNFAFRIAFGRRGRETPTFSPNLIFVGRRKLK